MTEEEEEVKIPIYWKYMPAVINASLIVLFGIIYKYVTVWLVRAENHRYEQDFENSIAAKTFMFNFVNTYISNFVAIIYYQNFFTLMTNLVTVMVFKQVLMNVFEFFFEKIVVGRKIKKSNTLFEIPLAEAELNDDALEMENLKVHQMVNR